MKKYVFLVLVVVLGVMLVSIVPAQSHDRFVFRGGVWLGPGPWWGPPYPYYGPYPYYYPNSPVVIEQQPQTYVQPAPQPEDQNYWYYCSNPEGYYPYVKRCPNGWLKVVPSAPSDERR